MYTQKKYDTVKYNTLHLPNSCVSFVSVCACEFTLEVSKRMDYLKIIFASNNQEKTFKYNWH